MNPMQNYPHIIELLAFALKIFALMLLFPINSSMNAQHQNYRNKQFQFFNKIKQSNVSQHLHIHQGLLHKHHFNCFRKIISRKNIIKNWFIFIIFLNFKVCSRMRSISRSYNPFSCLKIS